MAKKHSNRRRKKRSGRFNFLYKLLSVLLICAAIIVALTLFFKVEVIQITGETRYSEAELLEVSGVEQGDNLFLLNKYTVANRIMQELPYVENVRINRQPPDTLMIEVTECKAAVAILQGGSGWLLSPSGKLVEKITALEAEPYAKVDGCQLVEPEVGGWVEMENKNDLDQLTALLGALEDAGVTEQLDAIHLDDAGIVVMEYAGRFRVELPRGADFARKLFSLEKAITQLESNETGVFDMTEDGKAYFIPK